MPESYGSQCSNNHQLRGEHSQLEPWRGDAGGTFTVLMSAFHECEMLIANYGSKTIGKHLFGY